MSQYWFYRCTTCNHTADDDTHRVNHGQNALRALAQLGPALAALNEADMGGLVDLRLDVNIVLTGADRSYVGNRDILLWLGAHGDHQLELRSEYGDVAHIDVPCLAVFAPVDGVACGRSLGHPGGHEAHVRPGVPMGGQPWAAYW